MYIPLTLISTWGAYVHMCAPFWLKPVACHWLETNSLLCSPAHPFREGNGRATRIWLDLILKQEIQKVIDWNLVDKDEYLSAMQRSVVKDVEIKVLLQSALTQQIDDRALFMKGIDVSYFYEGYSGFKTEEL